MKVIDRLNHILFRSKPPFALAFRLSNCFILGIVCLAVFTDLLPYGLIVPVLPYSLVDDIGVAEDELQ